MPTNKNDHKKRNTPPSSKSNKTNSSSNNLFRSLPSRSTTPTPSAKSEQNFSTVPLVRKPPVRPMSPPSTTPRKPAAGGGTPDAPPVMPRRLKRAPQPATEKPDPKMRRSLSLNQVDVVQIPGSVTVKADTTEHLVDACQQYLDQMAEGLPHRDESPRSPSKGTEAADEIVVDGVDVVTVGNAGSSSSSSYGTHPRAMKKNISRTWVPAMKRMFEKRAGSVEPLSEIRLRIQMTPQRTRRSASPAVAMAAAPAPPQSQYKPREEEDSGDSAKSDGTESVSSFVALSVDNNRSSHSHSADNDGTATAAAVSDGDGDEDDEERAKNKGFLNKCMVRVKRAMSNSN